METVETVELEVTVQEVSWVRQEGEVSIMIPTMGERGPRYTILRIQLNSQGLTPVVRLIATRGRRRGLVR